MKNQNLLNAISKAATAIHFLTWASLEKEDEKIKYEWIKDAKDVLSKAIRLLNEE